VGVRRAPFIGDLDKDVVPQAFLLILFGHVDKGLMKRTALCLFELHRKRWWGFYPHFGRDKL